MVELLRTSDPVFASFVEALLSDAGIPYQIADRGMAVLEGTLPVIQPRILVADGRLDEARRLLVDAELL